MRELSSFELAANFGPAGAGKSSFASFGGDATESTTELTNPSAMKQAIPLGRKRPFRSQGKTET
jgi:hypothetical protein